MIMSGPSPATAEAMVASVSRFSSTATGSVFPTRGTAVWSCGSPAINGTCFLASDIWHS